MRFYRKAELIFLAENITVTGSRVNINIPVTSISRVYCMDDTSLTGKSREKLTTTTKAGITKIYQATCISLGALRTGKKKKSIM